MKIDKLKKWFFLMLTPLGLVVTISAQNESGFLKGQDAPIHREQSADDNKCFVYNNYVVKTNNDKVNGGEKVNVFIKPALSVASEACQTANAPSLSLTAIYTGNGGYENGFITSSFFGISGKNLFIKKDVEPFLGALEIFDLTSGKSIFKSNYYQYAELRQKRYFIFENWAKKDGELKNCKEAKKIRKDGLTIGWLDKTQFDLQTLKQTNIGLRCEPVQ